ncbi:hypothetical protein [Propionibacterium sp.]|uniref:hypothetical protein n=1 Tax=Propionibacterium sp. TaxID=1977903 RepID=UPI0039EAAF3E
MVTWPGSLLSLLALMSASVPGVSKVMSTSGTPFFAVGDEAAAPLCGATTCAAGEMPGFGAEDAADVVAVAESAETSGVVDAAGSVVESPAVGNPEDAAPSAPIDGRLEGCGPLALVSAGAAAGDAVSAAAGIC